MTYEEFIEGVEKPYGRCGEVTFQMLAQFPELKRVCGFYHCPFWGAREHWWLVAPDGHVVDPTAAQFPSLGHGVYEQREINEMPTGRCYECGEDCYHGAEFCSDDCNTAYMLYLKTCQTG